MRKFVCVILALAVMTVFPLTGCGNSEDTAAAMKAPVEGFLSSMQQGDFETMKTYADEGLFSEGGSLAQFDTLQNIDGEFAKELGVSESDISEETKAEVDAYVKDMMNNMIKSYEIVDAVQDSETTGTVTTKITFGFDPEAANNIDVNDEIEALTTEYLQNNLAELQEIYQNEGEEAFKLKAADDLVGDILKLYADKILATGEVTEDVNFKVENKDGSWIIVSEESDAI